MFRTTSEAKGEDLNPVNPVKFTLSLPPGNLLLACRVKRSNVLFEPGKKVNM